MNLIAAAILQTVLATCPIGNGPYEITRAIDIHTGEAHVYAAGEKRILLNLQDNNGLYASVDGTRCPQNSRVTLLP